MKKNKIVILVLLTLWMVGCNIKPPLEIIRSPREKKMPVAKEVPVEKKSNHGNIQVDRIKTVKLRTGDPDGVFLGGGLVKAIHLCTGEPIADTSYSVHYSGADGEQLTKEEIERKVGRIVSYAPGHWRYIPPNCAGDYNVEIHLSANDGCQVTVLQPIKVVGGKGKDLNGGDRSGEAKITIVFPLSKTNNLGRVCQIHGTTQGIAAGQKLDLVSIDPWGVCYLQDDHPRVKDDGTFQGWVFLGSESGNGIGDWFDIYAQIPGGRFQSQLVKVKRIVTNEEVGRWRMRHLKYNERRTGDVDDNA